tara:strand:+ start:8770 stop:9501 length:732 start_codon:yes stop_codon:yes gene_type:complete
MFQLLKQKIKSILFLFYNPQLTDEDAEAFSFLVNQGVFKEKNTLQIDVGANIGIWTNMLLKELDESSLLYAFEPLPKCNKILAKKFKKAIKKKKLKLFNCALSNDTGEFKFKMFNDDPISPASYISSTASHLNKLKYKEINVSLKMLDDLLEDRKKINFIKIDVEGHEMKAILGSMKTIKRHKPFLYIEILREKWNKSLDSSDLCELLKNLNYEIFQYDGKSMVKVDKKFNIKCENFLFIPNN